MNGFFRISVSQFVSLNSYNSNTVTVKCRVLSYWNLLFLIYINDLHVAIKNSEVSHLPDDTNLLNLNSCVKSLYKLLSYDPKNLPHWLKANYFFFNVGKTELVLFTAPKKQLNYDLNTKKWKKDSMK